MKLDNIQKIQEEQYEFPYHHLVNFKHFDNHKTLYGGLNYYGYISKVLQYINQEKFDSLLDVGCGDGKMIFELTRSNRHKKLTGIDFSERAILLAKAFNYNNGSEFICGHLNDIKGMYDVITMIEVMEHIPDEGINDVVQSVYNLLPQNGRLVISVPSTNDPLNSKHYRHYTLPILLQTLNRFNLEEHSFVISNSKLYMFLTKLSGMFSSSRLIRLFILFLSEKYFFKATEKNGTHIVAVFRKN